MTTPINPADTTRLRELISAATPLPWCCCYFGHLECREIGDIGNIELHAPTSPYVRARSEDDAALIVEAVNAIPVLLDQLDAQAAEIERRRAEKAEQHAFFVDASKNCADWRRKAYGLEAELAATVKARDEDVERFMGERDDARARVRRLEMALKDVRSHLSIRGNGWVGLVALIDAALTPPTAAGVHQADVQKESNEH